jgi:dTDP-L-rhamnose 4-epimerase
MTSITVVKLPQKAYVQRNMCSKAVAIALLWRSVPAMILVTGGAGFIGSHVVDELVCEGHRVRVLDSLLPAAHDVRPDYLNPEAEFVEGDVADPDAVDRALEGVDAVCHQAAMVGLGLDMLDVEDYVRHNDFGTAVLLKRLAADRFRGRLVLASSMVVYGEGAYRCSEHGRVAPAPRDPAQLAAARFTPTCPVCDGELEPIAVEESSPLDPRNVYAATKVHQEHLCFAFSRETGVPVTALRYHNVYGPRMPRDTPYAGVAAIFASALAAGASPRVFEDGQQLRDFVNVRDVARANVIALTCAEPNAGAFNVASGTPRTVGEMAEALADAAGKDARRPLVTGEFRLGDVRHVFASAERAERELGFKAAEDFHQGMAEFVVSSLRAA